MRDAAAATKGGRRRRAFAGSSPLYFFARRLCNAKYCTTNKELHVAIIMDGNGRWATRRGLPRTAGHRAGVEAVRRVVEAAPELGVTTLTLFAFSSDNWRRPRGGSERADGAAAAVSACRARPPRRSGRAPHGDRPPRPPPEWRWPRDRGSRARLGHGAAAPAHRHRLFVARRDRQTPLRAGTARGRPHATPSAPCSPGSDCEPPRRRPAHPLGRREAAADFLLWESAYAELCFVDTLWPDFSADHLAAALADFHRRERRFGGLGPVTPLIAAE